MSNVQITDSGPNRWQALITIAVIGIGLFVALALASALNPERFANAETIRAQQQAAVSAMEEQNRHLQETNAITESQAAAVSQAIVKVVAFATIAGYALVGIVTVSLLVVIPTAAVAGVVALLAWAYYRYKVARYAPVVTEIDQGWREVSQGSGRLLSTGTGANTDTNTDTAPNEIQAHISETRLLLEMGKAAKRNGVLDILIDLARYLDYPARSHALKTIRHANDD